MGCNVCMALKRRIHGDTRVTLESFLKRKFRDLSQERRGIVLSRFIRGHSMLANKAIAINGNIRELMELISPRATISKSEAKKRFQQINREFVKCNGQLDNMVDLGSKYFDDFIPRATFASHSKNSVELRMHKVYRYYQYLHTYMSKLDEIITQM